MPSADHIGRVCDAIDKQVLNILTSPAFMGWEKRPELQPAAGNLPGDLIVFNNSYLHRENAVTKSTKYVCISVDGSSSPAIIRPLNKRFNSDLTRLAGPSVHQFDITPMATAVEQELETLGSIVFALVGRIGEDEPAAVELRTGSHSLSSLRFEPGQTELSSVSADEIVLNRLDNIDTAWQSISAALAQQKIAVPTGFLDLFKKGFANLRETDGRRVDISDVSSEGGSILSEIVEGLEHQIEIYGDALAKHLATPEDTEAHNEVMRIAYNFSEGATELVRLIMGLSDMKPIIMWLTISSQANLAYQFRQLPMAGKEKPSITDYRAEVANARNSAFHDLFAFGRPFRVPLRSDAFSSAELRLFRAYGSTEPALNYSDRELVGLLERFTRTDEAHAAVGFWEQNIEVMKATCNIARALRDALLAVA